MKDLFGNLWTQLAAAGAPARWALAAVLGAVLAVGGYSLYAAKNPHYEVLLTNLDSAEFNAAAAAVASAGIRYRTTNPPGPYTIFVESRRASEALAAVHQSPDYAGPSRGISGDIAGAASIFLGASERDQRAEKRHWQEAELSLESLLWVKAARVTVSGTSGSSILSLRNDDRQAVALVSLAGGYIPDDRQCKALGGIVSKATGVSPQNVQVTDQAGNLLFDGAAENGGADVLAFERSWQRTMERDLQAKLDRAFAPGLTIVGVNGRWQHTRQESVEEALQPASKPVMKRSRKVEDPESAARVGGPVGTAANLQEAGGGAIVDAAPAAVATSDEKEESYAFGAKTTHTIANPHELIQMSISLVVDESRADDLAKAEQIVKSWASFVEDRDIFSAQTMKLPGLERDAEGLPILPEAEPLPEPADPGRRMLIENGVEILAALAFLFVLMRSLKSARAAATRSTQGGGGATVVRMGDDGKPVISDLVSDEEVDLDLLARRHVEELLESEPEKVSALLSRWALGEQFYAGAAAGSGSED